MEDQLLPSAAAPMPPLLLHAQSTFALQQLVVAHALGLPVQGWLTLASTWLLVAMTILGLSAMVHATTRCLRVAGALLLRRGPGCRRPSSSAPAGFSLSIESTEHDMEVEEHGHLVLHDGAGHATETSWEWHTELHDEAATAPVPGPGPARVGIGLGAGGRTQDTGSESHTSQGSVDHEAAATAPVPGPGPAHVGIGLGAGGSTQDTGSESHTSQGSVDHEPAATATGDSQPCSGRALPLPWLPEDTWSCGSSPGDMAESPSGDDLGAAPATALPSVQVWAVDGIPGAGKTTLIQALARELREIGGDRCEVLVVEEPVVRWQHLLQYYYERPQQFALPMQMLFRLDRLLRVRRIIHGRRKGAAGREPRPLVLLLDRSWVGDGAIWEAWLARYSTTVEAQEALTKEKKFKVRPHMLGAFMQEFLDITSRLQFMPRGILHLNVTPEAAQERVALRSRGSGEKAVLKPQFLALQAKKLEEALAAAAAASPRSVSRSAAQQGCRIQELDGNAAREAVLETALTFLLPRLGLTVPLPPQHALPPPASEAAAVGQEDTGVGEVHEEETGAEMVEMQEHTPAT